MFDRYCNEWGVTFWNVGSDLIWHQDSNLIKNYIFGMICYRYLSDRLDLKMNEELVNDKLTFIEAYELDEYKNDLKDESLDIFGYFIEPKHCFSNLFSDEGYNFLSNLDWGFRNIYESSRFEVTHEGLNNLFSDVDLLSNFLGDTINSKIHYFQNIAMGLNFNDFPIEDKDMEMLGDAFEYLISKFASISSDYVDEYFTSSDLSEVLAKIVSTDKDCLNSVFDPCCGTGSSLLRVSKEVSVNNFYGEEKNSTTFNTARMNMILHGIDFTNFHIKQGDFLNSPSFKDMKFDAIVSHLPIYSKFFLDNLDDINIVYDVSSFNSDLNFTFIDSMLNYLNDNGVMAVVASFDVISCGNMDIVKGWVNEKNILDAVIKMPKYLLYHNPISVCILVFKKSRNFSQDVLFIDASNDFKKGEKRNCLRSEDIFKIIRTYRNREESVNYSYKAHVKEIFLNDFSLDFFKYMY